MSEAFDPYYKWLAIPPKDQPPHHYRLLAIDLFEADPDVIANAADQRMSHLKAFQASQHGALSQQLLNEIATARTTLLNLERKQHYDAQLQKSMAGTSNPAIPPIRPQAAGKPARPASAARRQADSVTHVQPVQPADPSRATSPARRGGAHVSVATQPSTSGRAPKRRTSPPSKKPNRHQFKINVIGHIIAPLIGLMLGYLVLCWLRPEVSIFSSGRDDSGQQDLAAVDDDGRGADKSDPSSGDPSAVQAGNSTKGSRTPGDDAHSQKQQPDVTEPGPSDDGAGTSSSGTDPGSSPAATDTTGGDASTTTTDGATGETSNGDDGQPGGNDDPPLPKEPTLEEKLAELKDKRDKAISASNISKALDISQQIADLKEEDVLDAQAALLEQLHQRASNSAALKKLAENGLKLIDKAIAEGRAELARRHANLTLLAARRADDIALVRQATQRVIKVQELEAN